MTQKDIHEKAIRLLEGDQVEAEGLAVACVLYDGVLVECQVCEMDCLCHQNNEICDICIECSEIIRGKCYLKLVNP